MARALSDRLTLHACDLPGHGKSDDWDGETDLHDCCMEVVNPFLRKPHDLMGHSFGATVALRLAMERPERVRSLCLIEPVLFAAAALDSPEVLAEYKAQSKPILDALADNSDIELAARSFNRLWGDGRPWCEIPARTREYIKSRMHLIEAQDHTLFDDSANLLAPEHLARLSMPVLLIRGSESPPIAAAINNALTRRIPNARNAIIQGAGHMLPVTHATEVGAVISELLEETEELVDLRFGDGPVTDQSG